jgi:uncharacterized protein
MSDEYSLFYLKFIEAAGSTGEMNWLSMTQSAAWKTRVGYAFEGICLKHTNAIKGLWE